MSNFFRMWPDRRDRGVSGYPGIGGSGVSEGAGYRRERGNGATGIGIPGYPDTPIPPLPHRLFNQLFELFYFLGKFIEFNFEVFNDEFLPLRSVFAHIVIEDIFYVGLVL